MWQAPPAQSRPAQSLSTPTRSSSSAPAPQSTPHPHTMWAAAPPAVPQPPPPSLASSSSLSPPLPSAPPSAPPSVPMPQPHPPLAWSTPQGPPRAPANQSVGLFQSGPPRPPVRTPAPAPAARLRPNLSALPQLPQLPAPALATPRLHPVWPGAQPSTPRPPQPNGDRDSNSSGGLYATAASRRPARSSTGSSAGSFQNIMDGIPGSARNGMPEEGAIPADAPGIQHHPPNGGHRFVYDGQNGVPPPVPGVPFGAPHNSPVDAVGSGSSAGSFHVIADASGQSIRGSSPGDLPQPPPPPPPSHVSAANPSSPGSPPGNVSPLISLSASSDQAVSGTPSGASTASLLTFATAGYPALYPPSSPDGPVPPPPRCPCPRRNGGPKRCGGKSGRELFTTGAIKAKNINIRIGAIDTMNFNHYECKCGGGKNNHCGGSAWLCKCGYDCKCPDKTKCEKINGCGGSAQPCKCGYDCKCVDKTKCRPVAMPKCGCKQKRECPARPGQHKTAPKSGNQRVGDWLAGQRAGASQQPHEQRGTKRRHGGEEDVASQPPIARDNSEANTDRHDRADHRPNKRRHVGRLMNLNELRALVDARIAQEDLASQQEEALRGLKNVSVADPSDVSMADRGMDRMRDRIA
ncbi:hypothetical protein GGS26DRAFT_143984 [Hypomontagnella submonticulosa]|nr:hypothetical protein GGS26DRAFT_143984 [Hypomontagnella submonticulosa]